MALVTKRKKLDPVILLQQQATKGENLHKGQYYTSSFKDSDSVSASDTDSFDSDSPFRKRRAESLEVSEEDLEEILDEQTKYTISVVVMELLGYMYGSL